MTDVLSKADQQRVTESNNRMFAIGMDSKLRELWTNTRGNWYEMGRIAKVVSEQKLFQFIPIPHTDNLMFDSFDSWIADCIPEFGRSTVYAAKKYVEDLKDVKPEDLKQIPRGNAEHLRKLPPADRALPENVQAAKTMKEEPFKQAMKKKYPHAPIDDKKRVNFKPEKHQADVIEYGVKVAKWKHEVKSREEALEAIVAEWLDEASDVDGLSNREAYEQEHPKKAKAAKA